MSQHRIPHLPVIITGGGRAGLSVSWYLCAAGIEHLVLERAGKFESWRNNRWDSLCLITLNWQCRLPGWPYRGPDPDGFVLGDQVVDCLDGVATSFNPAILKGVTVTRIAPHALGYIVETRGGTYSADQVLIANVGYDTPNEHAFAQDLDPSVPRIH